jgi:dimethylglycine dehydrogenase
MVRHAEEARLTDHVRVAVIGGGAVGASCLYHLAKLGWTDAVLLEQDELTSGSTWHAAGNVPTFAGSWSLLKLQNYSASLYRRLGAEVGYPINYHVVGAIRLAHTRERMDEFAHVIAMARANGMEFELLPPEAIRERHPFVELDDLLGALWDPYDGDIDPAQLTQALAKGARDLGAKVRRFEKVVGLAQRPDGAWRLTTTKGEIVADIVVNAAGYRAGEVMALIGRSLPIVAMSHQYLVTDDIPALAERAARLPLMRDPDVSYYLRQERHGFILGPYEHAATPMWLDGIPENFSFQLWNDDLDRLESYILAAIGRVPLLGTVGIRKVINGPIPYSPDGNPYIGPEPGLRNFFHCNCFSFGISQAGGAGKALAEWVVQGRPEWDLWSLDRRRYTAYADQAYTAAKAVEVYQNEYAPSFPYEERPAGRPRRCSPLYPILKDKGGRFGARGGWERPVYFDREGTLGEATLSFRRRWNWMPAVAEEVKAVRERVGLMDLPGFSKFAISGPGAEAMLDRLVCSRLPRLGRLGLAYALTGDGKLLSEFTIARTAPDRFYLNAASTAEWHDDDLLSAALPSDGSVRLERLTESLGTLVLAGPRAREALARATDAPLGNEAFPWLSCRTIAVAGIELLAMRVNYVGELGWELHAPFEALPALYDALWAASAAWDIRDFGLYAMDSLRLDKGYRGWKADIETGFSPWEASLDRFVDLAKPDFTGRAALLAEKAAGPRLRFVPLVLDDPADADAPPCSPVHHGGERVGLATSGGWSFTLGASLALAYLRPDLAAPGTRVEVEILGARRAAVVAQEPIYDPTNARLRS